jgi:hypothetical protein
MALTQAELDRILNSQGVAQRAFAANQPTVTNTPRSMVSGTWADILKPIVSNPVGEFIGAVDMQRALDSASYGKPLTTGGSVQTGGFRPEYLAAALGLTPTSKGKAIVKTFNGKNLNKPLLDKFIKTNKLSPEEFAIYEDNAIKMADEGLHNINQANAKSNPYYDKYKSQFNIDAWRGMDQDVKSFDPTVGTGERSDTGVWTVDNPYNASTYAGKLDGGVVYPLKLRNYQLASVDVGKNNWNRIPLSDNPVKDTIIRNSDNTDYGLSEYLGDRSIFDDFASTNDVARIAKQNKNNRGIQFENVRDIGASPQGVNLNKVDEFANVYTMFDPSSLRSIFASFDPLRYKSKDILAGVAAAPAGLLAVDENKKKKK